MSCPLLQLCIVIVFEKSIKTQTMLLPALDFFQLSKVKVLFRSMAFRDFVTKRLVTYLVILFLVAEGAKPSSTFFFVNYTEVLI